MLFIMVFIKKNKSKKLGPQEFEEEIAFILFDEFLNCFNCAEEDAIWQSFKMNDLISNDIEKKEIWFEKRYSIFTDIMSKPESKRMVYLKLANSKKDNENIKENF